MVFFIFVFIFSYGYYSHTRTIHVYGTIHMYVLFIRRQQTLSKSSVGAIEADHSSTQQEVSKSGSLSLSMLCGCGS